MAYDPIGQGTRDLWRLGLWPLLLSLWDAVGLVNAVLLLLVLALSLAGAVFQH